MRKMLGLSIAFLFLVQTASLSGGHQEKNDKNQEKKADVVETVEAQAETPIAMKDPPFERFVELDMVGEAFREVNASLLADVALQLAEGERVLGRSHKGGVTSRALLDAAAKMAMLRHDVATLKRLAQKAKDRGDNERHADITTKIRLMGKTRSPLDEAAAVKATPSTQDLLKLHFDEMHRQLVIGDPQALQDMQRGFNEAASLPGEEFKLMLKLTAGHRTVHVAERNPDAEVLAKLAGGSRTSHFKPIKFFFDKTFNTAQAEIVQRAVTVVAHRFLDPRMFANAKQNCVGWPMNPGYLKSAGVKAGALNRADFEKWFLGTQLAAINTHGFPTLRIRCGFDRARPAIAGWTFSQATVQVSPGNIKGSFEIFLQSTNLANKNNLPWYTNNVDFWASVIAHEMLHNLGHAHPGDPYDGTLFIDAYDRAMLTNGTWKRGANLYGRQHPTGQ